MGDVRARAPQAGRKPAGADRARGGDLRRARAIVAGAWSRPAGGRAFREPAGVLHVRRRCRPAARQHVHPDAGARAQAAGGVPEPCAGPLRRDGHRRQGRVRGGGAFQRRALRRRYRVAAGQSRDRDHAQGSGARLVRDRPLDPGHAVRARARPGQALATRCALHRPREDHAHRRAGGHPPVACGVGDGKGRDCRGSRPRNRGQVETSADAPTCRGGAAAARLPRTSAGLHRARPGLRFRQLPLSGAARTQGPGAPGEFGSRGDGLRARPSRDRPGKRERDRDQPLCRRARARLGMDRRNSVDAPQRLQGNARSDPEAAGDHRMPRRNPDPGG